MIHMEFIFFVFGKLWFIHASPLQDFFHQRHLEICTKFLYPFNCSAEHEVLLGIICLLFGVRLFVPAALHQLPFLLAFWLLKLSDTPRKINMEPKY